MKKIMFLLAAVAILLQACSKPLGYAVVARFVTPDGRAFPWEPVEQEVKVYPSYLEYADGSRREVVKIDYQGKTACKRLEHMPDVIQEFEYCRARLSRSQRIIVAMDSAHKWASFNRGLDIQNQELCSEALKAEHASPSKKK